MGRQFETQIICVDTEQKLSFSTNELSGLIQEIMEDGLFSGKSGEIYSVRLTSAGERTKNTVFVGIGTKVEQENLFKIENAFGLAIKEVLKNKSKSVVVWMDERLGKAATAKAIEAMHLSKYSFHRYKTENNDVNLEISVSSPHDMKEESAEAILLAEQTNLARDLVNEPANVIYPETLAEVAVKEGEKNGFSVTVLSYSEIEALGMKSYLSVAMGSDKEPKLIVMNYDGGGNERIALVGKGLTYDSGGYSIKPTDGMLTMKSDMGGGAAVIGAMGAIAKSGLKANVVGIIAACENMISGHAYLPGNIIGTMLGKTIEIGNTDAEGRLTLIDAVTYAIREQKADKVIDIATLTGAAIVALGNNITAALSNDDLLWGTVNESAMLASEKIWRLPNDPDMVSQIKGKDADLVNTGGRAGGSITAGLFIEQFVEGKPWVHLDIAGPSFTEKATPICEYGATGAGVRTLYHTIKKLSE